MYLRWAERHRFATEIVDQTEGEETGLKSVTVETSTVATPTAGCGAERGVHRLVRISPYDSQKRRQTTFALVEVLPEVDDDVEIELDWDEIRVDTFRSQGAGGQHVNKTDSAVRLTHLPTGIVAQSQNERSQTQNKEMAIRVLKARLLERALEEKEAELLQAQGRARRGRLGQPDPELRPAPVPDGQGPADRGGDLEHRRRARRRPRRVHAGRARAASDRRAARRRRARVPSERRRRRATDRPCAEDLPACTRVWRAAWPTTSAGSTPTTACRSTSSRCAGCWPTSSRPTRSGSGSPSGRPAATAVDRVAPGDGGADGERVVGFGSANVRGATWFLAMLFVDPAEQARGIGRRAPGADDGWAPTGSLCGTATDFGPADLQRPLRAARDRAPDALPRTWSAGRTGTGDAAGAAGRSDTACPSSTVAGDGGADAPGHVR